VDSPTDWQQLDWGTLVAALLGLQGQWLVTAMDGRDQAFLVFHASEGSFRQTGEGLEIALRAEPLVSGGRFMILRHDFQGAQERTEPSATVEHGTRVFRIETESFTVTLEPHHDRV
jgi:hypothetical protein